MSHIETVKGKTATATATGTEQVYRSSDCQVLLPEHLPTVAFVIHQQGNRANGGLESITRLLTNFRRVRPSVITNGHSRFTERWIEAGIDVAITDARASKRIPRIAAISRDIARYTRRFRSSKPDVVHCNDIQSLVAVAPAAKLTGCKLAFNLRDTKAPGQTYGMKWRTAGLADRVIVLSKEMQRIAEERLPIRKSHREQSVTSIYSAVETPCQLTSVERLALRRSLGINDDEMAIGYIAGVTPKKQQLQFLERGIPLLTQRRTNAKVYFVGDFDPESDAYSERCRQAVDRLGLHDRVKFVGFSNNIANWYQAIDMTVIASQREGLARCMIESLANGTPVVSFDVCSATEILVGHRCGRVVAQGDYENLIRSIVDLCSSDQDRDRLGQNGITASKCLFDPDLVTRQYEDLYLKLAGRFRAGRVDAHCDNN